MTNGQYRITSVLALFMIDGRTHVWALTSLPLHDRRRCCKKEEEKTRWGGGPDSGCEVNEMNEVGQTQDLVVKEREGFCRDRR